MISDTTLEQILNLWKEDRIKLEEARKLLGLVEETIKWRQPPDPNVNKPKWGYVYTGTSRSIMYSPDYLNIRVPDPTRIP